MDKLYIIIPAYNEQDTISSVVEDWYHVVEKTGPESRLVIINDGSKDKTYDMLQKEAENRPQLIALNKSNSGHGATVRFGYDYALESGADYIFQTDSDGQTLSSEFDEFWELRTSSDMNIGHRATREDGISRIIVTKTLKAVCRICFGVSIIDANTPYRLMSAVSLRDVLSYVPAGHNLTNVLVSVVYARMNKKVNFIKITFRPRQGGVNSINIKKIIKIGIKAFKDFTNFNRTLKKAGY